MEGAQAFVKAARRPDLGIRFGHVLDPLEGGGVHRHRSSSLTVRAAMRYLQRCRFIRVS
jgi:hypothetical protein